MARARRNTRDPLNEELREEPYAFDFFQVVRILEAMRPDAAPVGHGSDPAAEAIRFRSDPSLAFPASEVVDVALPDEESDEQARVTVSFLGVAGGQGPLPRPFTELLLERLQSRDTAGRDFLDIFNHRLVSLLYRAREKHRVGLRIQRPEQSLAADMAFSLMGMGPRPLRRRMAVDDRSLLYYTGTLSHGRPTAAGLAGVLTDYFRELLALPKGRGKVEVREFVGCWRTLEPTQTSILGRREGSRLGVDTVLGGKVWDQLGMVEIVVGPLSLDSFKRFLPDGDALAPLEDTVAFYLRGDADFRIRLVLRAEEVPDTVLSAGPDAPRLGLTSWLRTAPFENDADDVVRLGGQHH